MQCIINDPSQVVDDMLKGFLKNHKDLVISTANPRVVKYKKSPVANKVGIVTGGGSGHEPAFVGYVGRNMVDAVAVGELFSSPTAQAFLDAFKEADSGNGVACLYGNYAGDNMNVKMAIKMAEAQGMQVKTIVANDDVASAPKGEEAKRRGVAGEIFMWKIGAALAATGASLDEVIAGTQKAIDNTRSVGIGLSPCTIPEVGSPNFTIEEGTMEFGIGHHGEPGIRVLELGTAKGIAKEMVEIVVQDLPFDSGDDVALLVSGLGATPIMELYILFDEIDRLLGETHISIYTSYVGNYFTSLEMKGATLTMLKLDEVLKPLIDLEVESMGLTQFGRR